MIAAFPIWNDRIAPVFDVAGLLLLLETSSGVVLNRREVPLARALPMEKAMDLQQLGVEELVCGAISRPMEIALTSRGIRVIPFVAGDLAGVVRAWLAGTLPCDAFAMPGCCGRWRNQAHNQQERNLLMNGKGRGGMGGGGGGRGQGGSGRGRMGGPAAAGPDGFCVCPQCGRKEPHQRGVPCNQVKCPDCGILMTRAI